MYCQYFFPREMDSLNKFICGTTIQELKSESYSTFFILLENEKKLKNHKYKMHKDAWPRNILTSDFGMMLPNVPSLHFFSVITHGLEKNEEQ